MTTFPFKKCPKCGKRGRRCDCVGWITCPDCLKRYRGGMWATQSHDQNNCVPKVEIKRKAAETANQRQRALDRLLARELNAVHAEDKLKDGLARGNYKCEKCGELKGWAMEKTERRTAKVATYTYCACHDGPNLGIDDPLSIMPGGIYGIRPYYEKDK